jgi:hypothetical protein
MEINYFNILAEHPQYTGKILLVGLSCNTETKEHFCVIEDKDNPSPESDYFSAASQIMDLKNNKNYSVEDIIKEVDVSTDKVFDFLGIKNVYKRGFISKSVNNLPVSIRSKVYRVDGVDMTITEISKIYGIPRTTLQSRLKRGLSIDEALELAAKKI